MPSGYLWLLWHPGGLGWPCASVLRSFFWNLFFSILTVSTRSIISFWGWPEWHQGAGRHVYWFRTPRPTFCALSPFQLAPVFSFYECFGECFLSQAWVSTPETYQNQQHRSATTRQYVQVQSLHNNQVRVASNIWIPWTLGCTSGAPARSLPMSMQCCFSAVWSQTMELVLSEVLEIPFASGS